MKFRRLLFLFIPVLLFMTASCRFTPPTITNARGFRMEDRPNGTKAFIVELEIENKNAVGFRLKNPLAAVKINNNEVARADAPLSLKVRARSKKFHTLELSSTLDWKKSLGTIGYTLTTGKVKVVVDGSMTARTLFWKKPLLFKVDREYSIFELLKQ